MSTAIRFDSRRLPVRPRFGHGIFAEDYTPVVRESWITAEARTSRRADTRPHAVLDAAACDEPLGRPRPYTVADAVEVEAFDACLLADRVLDAPARLREPSHRRAWETGAIKARRVLHDRWMDDAVEEERRADMAWAIEMERAGVVAID